MIGGLKPDSTPSLSNLLQALTASGEKEMGASLYSEPSQKTNFTIGEGAYLMP